MSFRAMDISVSDSRFPLVKKYLSSETLFDNETTNGIKGDQGSTIDTLLNNLSEEDGPIKRKVHHLNALAKVIKQIAPDSPDLKCRLWFILDNLRNCLSSSAKEIRAGVLRVLRYVLKTGNEFEIMMKLRINLLVARSVDAPVLRDIERLQAFRFIRQVVMVCPGKLPSSLVSPLVSIVLSDSEPVDTLTWSSLAILSEIVLANQKISSKCGVVPALLRGVLKSQSARVSESVVLTLTHLYNHPDSRQYIRPHLDVQSLLAPFTDMHYRYLVDNIDTSFTKSFKEKRVESAKIAVTAMFKSWPGTISLCAFDLCGISSFVEMLPLVEPFPQREMLDVLYNIFQLKVPVWTEDYREGVASIDPSQYCDEWSLDNGWVAEEGKALLPPKVMGRANLLDCYNAFLLACFMESNLFHCLVQVVKHAEPCISVMATILIGELLHLANSVLPAEYLGHSLSLPTLIASAMAFDCQEERNRASEVINCLNQVHQLKKENVKPSSLYLKLSLEQSGYFSGKGSPDTHIMKNVYVSTEMDEATLQSHIRDSQVLAVKEFQAWNWNLIFSLLQHPYISTVSLTEDTLFVRFIRTLTNFYKPNSRQYSSVSFSNARSRKFSSVGLVLVKYLTKMESGEDGLLISLVTDIVSQLGQVTASKVTSDVFSPSSISNKLTRDYFLLLGAISFHNSAILKSCKAYGPLLDICSISSRHDLHKLIVASLDFAHDVLARVILEKLLTSGDVETRLYATKHMRVLLRLNAPFFISWGMEMLIGQLYDLSSDVADEAIDILDEACEEESFLDVLVLQQPALLHLSEKGVSLFTRFVSVKRGYTMLSDLGHLKDELNAWMEDYNFRYVAVAEERLAETLTYYRCAQEGVYHRRSDTGVTVHKAFVPVHFYGQLVKQEEGCRLLRAEKHVEKLAVFLKQTLKTAEEICQTKAAIWALGHIGTSAGGLLLLIEHNLIQDLIIIAQTSPVLSVRGTCYYAICLISKTSRGADILLTMGWTSVRHSKEEKWPVRFEEAIEEISTPSSPLSPTSSFPSIGCNADSFEQQADKSPQKSSSFTLGEGVASMMLKRNHASVARNASLSSFSSKKGSFLSKNYHLRPIRPISLTSADQLDNTDSRLQRVTSTSRTTTGFLGVALPLQLQTMLWLDDVNDEDYVGSRAFSVSTDLFDKDNNFILYDDCYSHPVNEADLLEPTQPDRRVASPLMRQRRLPSQTMESSNSDVREHDLEQEEEDDTGEVIKPHKASVVSRSSISSSCSSTIAFDENSTDGRKLLHRECLELMYNLSSDVSQKKNVVMLNILFDKFPSLHQDVELYWRVSILLSTYPYKLNCRRYIQSKFNPLTFEKLTSIPPTEKTYLTSDMSPQMRRRSSTSDMNKLNKIQYVNTSPVTAVDENDVGSEDTASESSGDILEWKEDKSSPNLSLEDKDIDRAVELRTGYVADKGNRLSQLEIPDTDREDRMESVVEIEYDL